MNRNQAVKLAFQRAGEEIEADPLQIAIAVRKMIQTLERAGGFTGTNRVLANLLEEYNS